MAQLIIDKLLKLDCIELEFHLTAEETCFIHLPHLKSDAVKFNDNYSVNSHIRTLSDNGIIEKLRICGALFDESVANSQPPLKFKKLQIFSWTAQKQLSGILKAITKSQMPEIESIKLSDITTNDLEGLINFIESKNTLKSIKCMCDGNIMLPLSFWRQIISILKDSSMPRRPFLSFCIWPFKLGVEVVS